MEFKRINKDTVTCIITEDDMFEQGIKLEDLFEKKKEAMDFLHDVMKKAEEAVDYKPTGSFTPMQITVLPDHTISLTLSENASESFGEILKNITQKAGIQIPKNILQDLGDCEEEERVQKLNEYLQSLKQLTSSFKNIMGDTKNKNKDDKGDNMITLPPGASPEKRKEIVDKIANKVYEKYKDRKDTKKQEELDRLHFHECMFSFADLSTVIAFSAKAPTDLAISSALYRNAKTGKYYLDLVRGSEDPKRFASLFTMTYEFGHFSASNPTVIAHIKETYDCIIATDAVKKLAVVGA